MVKSTGIVRRVDELGRIVIPMELRNKLSIAEKDSLEIFVDGTAIVLKKYTEGCVFCGSDKKLYSYDSHLICERCKARITLLED